MDEPGDHDRTERTVTIPDFTQEALAHLQVQSDDLARDVQRFVEVPDQTRRQRVCDDLARFRNTLVLLDKSGAVFVAEELLTLLQVEQDELPGQNTGMARVLLLAADQLNKHVALLLQDPGITSALPLLPLVNDSRACRGESLVSDVLVLAAGIELPEARIAAWGATAIDSESDREWARQRQAWIECASSVHSDLAQSLLSWWHDDTEAAQRHQELEVVCKVLDELAAVCQSRDYLETLLPLIQASSLVARAIGQGELTDGPALRSLYAQLERSIHRCARVVTPDDLLPGDLLRNFLYYLAQIESHDPVATRLRRRFRLDRIRQAARANDTHDTPTIGVGYHLARAIRNSLAAESESLREWLGKSFVDNSEERPRLIRLRVRLRQLEPVLTLMGAPEALACLQRINVDLGLLDSPGVPESDTQTQGKGILDIAPVVKVSARHDLDSPESICQRLAESLSLLDTLLDKNARGSVRRSATPTLSTVVSGETVFVDMAVDACLREARTALQSVADSLEELLPAGTFSTGRCHAVTQQLQLVDQVLQILPLPEVSTLLQGLGDVLTHLQLQGRQSSSQAKDTSRSTMRVHEEVATLLVSIDYYLACVLQPQASASQLLVDAEEALLNARSALDGKSDHDDANGPDQQIEQAVKRLLPCWDALGAALSTYRREAGPDSLAGIGQSLKLFREEACKGSSPTLKLLASSVSRWFERVPCHQEALDAKQLGLLDEVHGVMPQLIDQWLSNSENVRDLEELLSNLDNDEATLTLHDTSGLTLNIDDDLLPDSMDDSVRLELDNTLQHVFHYECLGHLEELEASIKSALQPSASVAQRLPTEQMLRSLHTLAGSAQAVDASYIVAIVQPLQRAALARQREGSSFDAAETRYIGELLFALRARLNSLATEVPVEPEVEAIEARLSAFVARIIPGSDAADSGLGLASNVRSLNDVFGEEARELLDRMRLIVHSAVHGPAEIRAVLSLLHTLKGSARMAGRVTIAEQAHALESDIKKLHDAPALAAMLKAGYTALSGLLRKASAQHGVGGGTPSLLSTYLPDVMLVSDSAFEGLLDLATDVTVNQARLSDGLARMREIYQDIETTSYRWHALPDAEQVKNSAAITEMMADLEAASLIMRDALKHAEREQQQASRAAASLQQTLIRTRLVRVDEARDRLSQAVQDAAEETHRHAQIVINGGELTLDRGLYRKLLAPLEHLARNAIVHGIETEAERRRVGKAATGCICLTATIDGTDLVLELRDDGRGIDQHAVNRLLAASGEPLIETHEDLQAVLFRSGFTSIQSPTALAGHGLGLAAVQVAVEQLGGRVQIATQPGEGTRVTLRIPQRIVVNQVVLVECGGLLFAIPVSHVEAVRMAGATVDRPETHRRVALSRLLSGQVTSNSSTEPVNKAAVLVHVHGIELALEVDQIIGYRELVTQALGPQLATLQRYSGGSVMSDGRQVLIVDLNNAVELLGSEQHLQVKPARESLRPVALVVDDSLTMRTAAASVLQQCGIAVRQSRDGIEALESLAIAMPNLIILDIEMPRLDGYDFLARIREEYGAVCPPIIVISSRDHPANRQRMQKLGVVSFLCKPYSESQLQVAIEAAGLRLPDITIA